MPVDSAGNWYTENTFTFVSSAYESVITQAKGAEGPLLFRSRAQIEANVVGGASPRVVAICVGNTTQGQSVLQFASTSFSATTQSHKGTIRLETQPLFVDSSDITYSTIQSQSKVTIKTTYPSPIQGEVVAQTGDLVVRAAKKIEVHLPFYGDKSGGITHINPLDPPPPWADSFVDFLVNGKQAARIRDSLSVFYRSMEYIQPDYNMKPNLFIASPIVLPTHYDPEELLPQDALPGTVLFMNNYGANAIAWCDDLGWVIKWWNGWK